jgi:hypothetical protein
MYTMAGRTGFLVRTCWRLPPLPASFMKYRATLWTDGGLRKLALGLVSIVLALLKDAIMAGDLAKSTGDALGAHNEPLLVSITWFT